MDNLKTFNFLAGNNQEYDQIKARVLADPFSTLMRHMPLFKVKNQASYTSMHY